MEGDLLNTWLERIGGRCPKCRKHIHEAPADRCPLCQQRLMLGVGIAKHDAAAWITGLIALAVSLVGSLFPFLAAISIMFMEGNINEIIFFSCTCAGFVVILVALVIWIKIRGIMQRLPAWKAWTLAMACVVLPPVGALGVTLMVAD
jgi:hypothetical protein